MPRFSDEWLLDRVLFDYVGGGSCACCGFRHFLPGGTEDLIGAVTDLDTDQANAEVAALENHPWPKDLRDQIWASRVRLRQKLKRDMKDYATFWKEHGETFEAWCRENYVTVNRQLQVPRSEIMLIVQEKYGVHSAFGVVLCAVLEQVAYFHATQYPPDARGESEIKFEDALEFSRMGGFMLPIADEGELDEDNLQIWLNHMKSLGGPKLLQRGHKVGNDDDDNDGDADGPTKSPSTSASFQSDRRILRLIIARYWADLLIKKFLEGKSKDGETQIS